uniref:Multidrug-efflux transporter n=1 Tax=Candidatus Kentrum sp. SD TaxID=2126332 RepID=A0A450YGT7_9GAMM|nr:MAG: multidrug resistance protein, MATE family [Candidatus Kentron sp. SD]VFK46434.1 MAG: multidrug resistance protein, MATE family [Candidatus Kentron sp. SD]
MSPNRASESLFPRAVDIRATFGIALPLALGYLGKTAIGVTDNIMLGRLGIDALGAAGLASSVYAIFLTIGIGMLFPAMVLISQVRGGGRSSRIPEIIRQGMWISVLLCVPACVVLWRLEDILLLTGQDAILAKMAGHYMNYYLWAMFPALSSFMFSIAFTAMGRTRTVFLVAWFEVGLNIILNYVLIFGKFGFPAMGMAGAGLASIIVYGAGFGIFFTLLDFHGPFRSSALFRRAWRPRWTILGRFLQLGWPKSLEILINKSLFSVATLLAGWFGTEAVAAHAMALQVSLITFFIIAVPLGDATTTRIGIAYGRREGRAEIWRILGSGLLILLFSILCPALVLAGFPEWIIILFTGIENPRAGHLAPLASPLIMFVALFVIVDGLRMVIDRALNGLGDMKIPALIAALAHWGIGFTASILFGFVMKGGILGLWLGLTLGMAAAALSYLLRFHWLARNIHSSEKPSFRVSR